MRSLRLQLWRCSCAALAAFAACNTLLAAIAQIEPDTSHIERRVKAAFLHKFAAYVDWPESAFPRPDTPIVIGVLGDDPIASELSQLAAARALDGRAVVITRVKEAESLSGVHVLFIGKREHGRLNQVAKLTQSRPLLIVTDSEGALSQGSMINFVVINGRVRFQIALDEAERRGLRLSSRLLAVAHNVVPARFNG